MKTGSITYNGKNSLTDLGIYITGSGSFDAAELDVDRYEVAGRNGDIIIPKKRYKNIPISYPAFIQKGFDGKVQSVRNWLRRAKTYARLEDTYDVNHFRLGLANGVQSFEPVNRNDASNFQLNFDCRPERFLKTGETPLTIEPEAHSYSGEVVTFETVAADDMTKAEVSLSPIQSLNGYDHPWPAGSTKNLFSASFVKGKNITTASGGDVVDNSSRCATVDYIAVTGGQTYTLSKNNTTNVGVFYYDANKDYIDEYLGWDATPRTFTVPSEASYVRFSYYSSTVPTNVQLEVGQTATDYIPCSNICPIVGHDSATLNVARKNVSSVSSCTSTINGTLNTSSGNFGTCFANVKYTISFDVLEQNAAEVRLRFNNGSNIKTWASGAMTVGSRLSFTYTPTNDGSFNFNTSSHSFSASATVFDNIQVEVGETATAYEPYSATTYTVTFGQTVYGGTYDWVTGKLTVTWKSAYLDVLTWTAGSDAVGQYFKATGSSLGIKTISGAGTLSTMICSTYPVTPSNNVYDGSIAQGAGANAVIYVRNTNIADATAFQSEAANIQLVFELATPLEYTLTPAQISTLNGLNNVWASDGTVEINYADPFNVDNPTYFEARPLFEITNPAQGDILNVNGNSITFVEGYTGTVYIDCETMDCFDFANRNYLISATEFPVLNEGLNIVTWSGTGSCKMTPRWWEL